MKEVYKAYFYAFCASFMWAAMTPLVKQGIGFGFTPMNFAGFRFTLAGLIITAITYRKGMFTQVLKYWKLFFILVFVNIFIGCTAYYLGVNMLSSSIASLIVGSAPLLNLVLIHFLAKNDKMNIYKLISLPIGVLGVSLLTHFEYEGGIFNKTALFGITFLLVNIVSNAYAGIKVAESKIELNTFFINGIQMLIGGILIFISAIYVEGLAPFWEISLKIYPILLILVTISITGFALWFKALKTPGVKVSNVNMFLIINPIVGVVMSVLLLEEKMDFALFSGMIIITLALVIYSIGERKAIKS